MFSFRNDYPTHTRLMITVFYPTVNNHNPFHAIIAHIWTALSQLTSAARRYASQSTPGPAAPHRSKAHPNGPKARPAGALVGLIRSFGRRWRVCSIGGGSGVINPEQGVMLFAPNIPGWEPAHCQHPARKLPCTRQAGERCQPRGPGRMAPRRPGSP